MFYYAHACIPRNRGVIFKKPMKKLATIIFITLSLLIILDSFNFGHAIMMFYLAGIIPGTNIVLNAAQMLEFFAIIAGFTVARVMAYSVRSLKPRARSISAARA